MADFLVGYVLGDRVERRAPERSRSTEVSAGSELTGDIHDANERIDRLLLVVDALWSMLKERGYTDEDLAERIRTIDGADGLADGARKPRPRRCSSCDAMVEPGRKACAFCGAEMIAASPLDAV